MALFSYLINEGIYFEIAHVNYHILKQADDDERGIRDEAKKYNITVHVLETNMPSRVNEEDWARDVRYNYFEEVSIKTGIKDVLVAHNEDDLIETYYLQKERNNIVSYYGLKETLKRKNYNVIRPLLGYSKKYLLDYCIANNIPYSIDPSNFDSKFKRNKYRKEVVSNMSDEKRDTVLNEIHEKNINIAEFLVKYKKFFKDKTIVINDVFIKQIDDDKFDILLIELLKENGVYVPISRGASKEIYLAIKSKKGNWKYTLKPRLHLYCEYGVLSIHYDQKDYLYKIDMPDVTGIFMINSKAKNFELVKDKFPLYVKNVNPNEVFYYDNKTLKVNREFISWKVPLSIRSVWPGIYDNQKRLIYVPKYQAGHKVKDGLLKFNLNDIYE